MWLTAFQDRDVTRLKSWGGSILVFGPVLGTSGWINTNVSKKKVKKERGNPQHVKIIWNRQDQYEAGRSMGPFSISSGSKCMQYVYILHTYIYTYMWMGWQPQNTLAASYQTCNLALLVQFGSYQMKKMKKRITLWYSEMLTLSNLSSNPGSPNSTGFAMAPKSRHGEPTPQPSLWPLSLVLSKARKGICRSQVKARLASRVDFTHTHIYIFTHTYIYKYS